MHTLFFHQQDLLRPVQQVIFVHPSHLPQFKECLDLSQVLNLAQDPNQMLPRNLALSSVHNQAPKDNQASAYNQAEMFSLVNGLVQEVIAVFSKMMAL